MHSILLNFDRYLLAKKFKLVIKTLNEQQIQNHVTNVSRLTRAKKGQDSCVRIIGVESFYNSLLSKKTSLLSEERVLVKQY